MPSNLLFIFCVTITTITAQIFIDQTSPCFSGCTGTLSQPYSSLWSALSENLVNPNTIIFLLKSSQPHYLFKSELNSQGTLFTYSQSISLVGNYTIQPLYANDLLVLGNSSLQQRAFGLGE